MRRAAPNIPISATMFRHFSLVTVSITALLALFADGENAEAIKEKIQEHQQRVHARQAEGRILGPHKIGSGNMTLAKGTQIDSSPPDSGPAEAPPPSSDGKGFTMSPMPGRGNMPGEFAPGGPLRPTDGIRGPKGPNGYLRQTKTQAAQHRQMTARDMQRMLAASRRRAAGETVVQSSDDEEEADEVQ